MLQAQSKPEGQVEKPFQKWALFKYIIFDVVIDNELCIAQKKTQQALCYGKLHCILKVER